MTIKERIDNKKLAEEVKSIWENNKFSFEFYHALNNNGENATTVKIYSNIFNEYGWVKTPAVIADELSRGLLRFLEAHFPFGGKVGLCQTAESIVAPLMGGDILVGADPYITTYYVGNVELNPPNMRAWLVVRVTEPRFARKEYIHSVGDSLKIMRGDQVSGSAIMAA